MGFAQKRCLELYGLCMLRAEPQYAQFQTPFLGKAPAMKCGAPRGGRPVPERSSLPGEDLDELELEEEEAFENEEEKEEEKEKEEDEE